MMSKAEFEKDRPDPIRIEVHLPFSDFEIERERLEYVHLLCSTLINALTIRIRRVPKGSQSYLQLVDLLLNYTELLFKLSRCIDMFSPELPKPPGTDL